MVQRSCIIHQENNTASIPRHVERDDDRSSCLIDPTLRDQSHGDNPNVEPVLQSTGINDGETSVKQEEVASTSPNAQQRRSISSQVAAVNGRPKNEYRAVRNELVLRNKTAITTADENNFFAPGRKQDFCALP